MSYHELVLSQKAFFNSNNTKSYSFRVYQLMKLKRVIIKYQEDILDALYKDLGKNDIESYMTEVGVVLNEITYIVKNLKKWMKVKKVKTPLFLFKAKSYIINEPLGTTLILAPWNYPFQLTIMPLIGAIAAGNCAIIKPSSQSVEIQKIIDLIISETFESNYVACVSGSSKEADLLLDEKFDYIFFTGSSNIGKHVMAKASKNLTPVTLELGGKSPAIIDETVSVKLAARRIVFGKFINAGQTCIAPDYLFIKNELKLDFIKYFNYYVTQFYGQSPLESDDYPKIINKKQHSRLIGYLKDKNIASGGTYNDLKITPTLLDDITFESDIMQDEIFGPILPLITYSNIDEVINLIKEKDKPLALYLFTKDKNIKNKVLYDLSFGGGVINDTLMHFANHNLSFGGVGYSGMGKYHGHNSFKLFSNEKSILDKATWTDLKIRYHPYTEKKYNTIRRFLK